MLATAQKYWGNRVFPVRLAVLGLLFCAVPFLVGGCATPKTIEPVPENITTLEKWNGNYPVSELDRLPEGQQDVRSGYIGDTATFIPVWRAFMPDEILPAVDFSKYIVVFTRNTQFYNRTSILKVTVLDKAAEIIAMETMSAMPVEKEVAMAMAVIPRDGITAIKDGTKKIPVTEYK